MLSDFLSADKIYSKDSLDITQNKWIVGVMLSYQDKKGVINWMYVIQIQKIRWLGRLRIRKGVSEYKK